MDHPPPPPLFRHHHLRYENVLRPPYSHHLPPPPPQRRQPYILFPPQRPLRNIAPSPNPMPTRLNFSSQRHPTLVGYHNYEIGLPPETYLHRNFPPPLPHPQNRENVHLRLTHDYSDRNPLSQNQIILEGRTDRAAKELHSRIPDRGDYERHSYNFFRSRELYNNRYNMEIRRHNGIQDFGRDLYDEIDCGEKRSDSVMNKCGSEFHKKMDYDGTRRDSINGWIRGLCNDTDHDDRRSGSGSGVRDRGLKLYCEGNDDGRRLNHGRCSGSFRSGVSEREFVRPVKKRRLQKIQSPKECSRYNEGHKCPQLTEESSGVSSRGKEREVFASLLTRTDGKRDGEKSLELAIPCKSNALMPEAILTPPCSAVETNITSTIVVKEIPSSIPGLPTFKSKEDMVKTDLLACGVDPQPDSVGTSIELLDKDAVSESVSVEDDANDLGEVAVKHQPQEDLKLQGLSVFYFNRRCRNRLKRKRKAKKKLLHETSMEMKPYCGEVTIANDCTIPSASPQHWSTPIARSEIAVKNHSQEDLQLQAPIIVESRTTRRKRFIRRKLKAKKNILHETSTDLRKDSGEITDVNDCIISSAFPQPCSTAVDLGEIDVKNQTQEDMKLKAFTVFGARSARRKRTRGKWEAKNFFHETRMEMRKDSDEIVNAIDCIIPSAPPQSCSAAVDLAIKNQHQEDMNLHSITAFGSDSTRGKKRKAKKKLDVACSSQEARCSPEIHPSNASAEFHSPLPLMPQTVIIFDVGSAVPNSKEVFLKGLNIPQVVESQDLVPSMEIDFLCEKGISKEACDLNRGLSRVEDQSLKLNFDANGLSPSFCKKKKVARPRSNLSSFLEDDMVANGLNGVCPKLDQGPTRLPGWETEKREDSCFSSNTEASVCQSENEMIFDGENISNRQPESPDLSLLPFEKSLQKGASENSQINVELSHSLPEVKNEVVKKMNLVHGKQTMSKNQLISPIPKVFPGHHPLHSNDSRKLQSTLVGKSRTWHRSGNSSVAVAEQNLHPSPLPQSFGTKTAQTTHSSYVRKGNSLVRHSSPSAVTNGFQNLSCSVYRLSHCTDNLKNGQASVSKTGGADASLLRTKLENNSAACKFKDASVERIKSIGVSECRADPVNSSKNTQNTLEEGNLEKKIIYVKRRSNQLVAASNSGDIPILAVDKSQASSSAGYFKSNNNQLVRASSENHVIKDANRNSCRLMSRTVLPRTCTKQMSAGFAKSYRNSKFSFVWKLHDMQSSEKDKTSVVPWKVLPHLSPWKRTTYWRSFMNALSLKPNKRSFSIASQALPLSRKRGAIYTRSTHGYSLRMSKVLSVGGSSLKWSKSIERDSMKVNEEAARAVAAAEKRKKEGNGAVLIASKRNNISRERIFRIGLERYKMDPSRRTLHRITAEPKPPPSVIQSVENVKRSFVPRRLLIGNEEYVRIGNGNQLVRDPKKRTRVLASEKVRWSLRTVRLKLARKRKYCQFFTRFGKCNKDDGKCPYIHDPSKVAVCTKFLNDLCTSVDCKLTHKVIPERMEDCSYFLKGSCSNETCPYRHVNVNSKSAVCKNFLRGHCADGNECQKKHTYICPVFGATGSCPKESACKLHHPKNKIEKRQPMSEQKAVRGRYFNGGLIGDAEVSIMSTEKVSVKGKDDIVGFQEGQFPDYISLDFSDMEVDQEDDFDVLV